MFRLGPAIVIWMPISVGRSLSRSSHFLLFIIYFCGPKEPSKQASKMPKSPPFLLSKNRTTMAMGEGREETSEGESKPLLRDLQTDSYGLNGQHIERTGEYPWADSYGLDELCMTYSLFFFSILHIRNCDDCQCTHNNRIDRIRRPVAGMESGSVRVDCWPDRGDLLCCNHIRPICSPCWLLQISRTREWSLQELYLRGCRETKLRWGLCKFGLHVTELMEQSKFLYITIV